MIGVAWGFDPSRVALGASMGSAQITAVRNAVEKVENEKGRPVVVSDLVVEGDMVRTRSESLAELTFSDKTIARMGANSQFSYSSQERLVKIEKGTVLMHTPPGNGGATITSGGVTGAISGNSFLLTANPAVCTKKPCQQQMRERPNELDPLKRFYCEDHPDYPQKPSTGGFAIVVLEGKDITKVTGPNGQTVELRPGEMALVGPTSEGAPKVFYVDLATIVRTCPLIQAFPTALPSFGEILQTAMLQQNSGKKDLDLSGVAMGTDGDIFVAPSDPPSPYKYNFDMASNTPGSGQKYSPVLEEDIDTAAGGENRVPFVGPNPPAPAPPAPPNPPIPPPPNPNNLPVTPSQPTALTVTGPSTLVAGQLATFIVSMDAPATTPTMVTLNNDLRLGDAPITVMIPAGATSVNFTAQIPSAGINFSSGSANILASASGMTSGNYSKNLVPTPLPDNSYSGAIAGSSESPVSDLRGAKMDLFASHDITLNGVDANRVGQGMEVKSFSGKVTIDNSSFDAWMQRDMNPFLVPDFGYGLTTFNETNPGLTVTALVLGIKMSPTGATGSRFTGNGIMFLGDYIVRVQQDPDGIPLSGDEVGVNFLDRTGIVPDPFDFGSVANGADLVLYDSATTSVNTIDYNSIDVAAGDYQPDSPAAGLNGPSALGTWEVRASDNSIGGEGQVDEVKLKYGYSKALIQGANGVELVNVQFEGMDEVEVRQDLNNRVLLSGTLASDPKISKMLVQAGQALQAHFDSDATVKNLTASGAAEILAGVQPKSGGGYEFIPGSPDRVLEMQTANLAGQLSLASHTVVFHNANITSGGVIQVRTRDGMVNMNYGSVVPGTTSFIGASGNNFRNTANGVSMTIANSGNISSAFTGGQLTDVNSGGAGTVMNVGKVQ